MARADLLINLVKAGSKGDQTAFQRTAESIIAEERENKHHVLADRLASVMRENSETSNSPGRIMDNGIQHLLFCKTPDRQLSELTLSEQNRTTIEELVEEHHRSDLLKSYGMLPRNRIMLIGPPGNGKTALAEVLADQLMVPFLVVRYEGLIGSFLGETATRLQKIFDYARQQKCVLFFDEFDVVGKERGDTHETGEIKRVVSSLLLQIDALPSYTVVVIASNHAQLLDSAVWRRFQVRLELPRPTKRQLVKFIQDYENQTHLEFGVSVTQIVDKVGFDSFSAAEDFCRDVYRRSIIHKGDTQQITQKKIQQWSEQIRLAKKTGAKSNA